MAGALARGTIAAVAILTAPMAIAQEAAPPAAAPTVNDPFEPINRMTYRFNTAVDAVTFKPAARFYKAVLPAAGQRGVTNGLNHLGEPFSGLNALAQGKVRGFFRSLDRILINTIFGFGGLADRATEWGIERQEEDFGQTLAVWGVPDGPYVIMPFLGPSNFRDGFGFTVEFFYDPADIAIDRTLGSTVDWSTLGVRLIDLRARALDTVDGVLARSEDPYVTLRSAYMQRRAFQINDGVMPTVSADDPFDQPDEPAPPQQ
jgi:phospholipid-binding lipoprotein MlaA